MKYKFLISSCTGLGNMIQKTPMIRSFYDYFPNIKIDLITGGVDNAEAVLHHSKYINKEINCNNNQSIIEKIKFVLQIRKNNYQYIFFLFRYPKIIALYLILLV